MADKSKAQKGKRKIKAAVRKSHWIRLTRTCNNNCIFCLDKGFLDGTVISLKEIKKDLLAGRKRKINEVILSGGEPTLHPNFIEIVGLAKSFGYHRVSIVTNGRMFAYGNFLKTAVNAGIDKITFSIHGHTEKLHDSQTLVEGSFKQVIAALKSALKMNNLAVKVVTVVNKSNFRSLPEILKNFINLGVTNFDLLQVFPCRGTWKNRNEIFYDMDDFMPYLKKSLKLAKSKNIRPWLDRFDLKYLEGFEDFIQFDLRLEEEVGGKKNRFENFLRKGKPISCRGGRCRYCYLKNFCEDLAQLRKKGKLASKRIPRCLEGKVDFNKPYFILDSEKVDVFNFLNFFVKYRYFTKGRRCLDCKYNSYCDGMQCDYIKRHGFNYLKPYNKFQ